MNKPEYRLSIWRTIYLNTFEDLDMQNFGCHWTKDEFYDTSIEFTTNDISKSKRKGKLKFVFNTEVPINFIDKKRTAISNKQYPSESECVLNRNTVLNNVKLIFPNTKLGLKVNTGVRIDDWT